MNSVCSFVRSSTATATAADDDVDDDSAACSRIHNKALWSTETQIEKAPKTKNKNLHVYSPVG